LFEESEANFREDKTDSEDEEFVLPPGNDYDDPPDGIEEASEIEDEVDESNMNNQETKWKQCC
jgi:hypothetical protein